MDAKSTLKVACMVKPFKSFINLRVGSYYVVFFQRISLKNVEKIRVDFVDFFTYLPQRFSKIMDDNILAELNGYDTTVVLMYSGKSSDGSLLIDFDIARYDVDVDVF